MDVVKHGEKFDATEFATLQCGCDHAECSCDSDTVLPEDSSK